MGSCEITVDSGAEESVWPSGWLPEEPTVTEGVNFKRFVAANGHEMPHYGQKQVKFTRQGGDAQIMSLNFEVTDVTKPLVAVRRIVERGNEVHFDKNGGWIENVASGRKIPLKKKGGCYVMSVELLADTGVGPQEPGFTWQA